MNGLHIANNIELNSFKFNPNGLEIVGNPSFDQWLDCGKLIYKYNESLHFVIGDWLNYGELQWKDTYKQAVIQTGFDYQTLRNDKWVAARFDLSRRRDKLPFDHYKTVANMAPDEQDELLEKAEEEQMTVKEFRNLIAQQTMQEKPKHREEKAVPMQDNQVSAKEDMETILSVANDLLYRLEELEYSLLSDDDLQKILKPLRAIEIKAGAIQMRIQEDE